MIKRPFSMTPEDLDRYDHDGTGDEGLRAALKKATELQALALHRLITGTTVSVAVPSVPPKPGKTR